MKEEETITEQQFQKRSYKSYMEIWHCIIREENPEKCMLLAVDFDEGLFKLMPFPEAVYEEKSFWSHYSHCQFPPRQFPPRKAKMDIIK